jgi:hypothetical protein
MDLLQLDLGDSLFQAGNGVLEVFLVSWDSSVRFPLAWLNVQVDPPRRGHVLLRLGLASPPGRVLYGPDAQVPAAYRGVSIAAADEPKVRAFFAELASKAELAGRTVEP